MCNSDKATTLDWIVHTLQKVVKKKWGWFLDYVDSLWNEIQREELYMYSSRVPQHANRMPLS